MSFLHPEFLYYMLPALIVLFTLLLTQKDSHEHFFSQEVMDRLRVSSNTLTMKARNALFFMVGLFIIVALAQPVIKNGKVEVKAKSADIMIALDISDSMLAQDIYPNRLESAKQKALTLLAQSPNERIGVVAFAKNSYLVSPLSFDSEAVAFLLRQLDTSSITEKGTDLLSVIDIVAKSQKDKKKKYLLLLSDGGDKDNFSQEIELAKENGVIVFVLGMGTKKGAPVKLKDGTFIKYKGDIIISRLNENIADLATKTGGVYIQSTTSAADIKTMFKEITKISDEKEFKSEEVQRYIALFYYPLALAIFLLLIATSSISKKTKTLANSIVLVSLVLSNSNLEAAMLDFMKLDEAKNAYEKGEFEKSQKLYGEYANKNANGNSYYNSANSMYKQKKYKEAIKSYKKATFDDDVSRANNYANLGNAYAKNAQLKKSVESYEKSLKLKEDKQTRENLEAVKKFIKKQKDKKKNKDKKQDSKNKNKDKKDSKKKESDEKQKKSDDSKDKDKNEKNSSKSKDSKDKQKNKQNDMKSKKEKSDEQKNKEEKNKDKQDKKKSKKDLQKLDKDKKEQKAGGAKEMKKQQMSDAEEKKWIKELNSNSNTYLYQLNKNQTNRSDEDEKPW